MGVIRGDVRSLEYVSYGDIKGLGFRRQNEDSNAKKKWKVKRQFGVL